MSDNAEQGATANRIADQLARLYGTGFGGKPQGRYRMSRKVLRQIAGRRRLPAAFLEELADQMFERGFVLIDLESYFIVLEQRLFRNYRRVTDSTLSGTPTRRSRLRASAAGDAGGPRTGA